MEDDRCEEIKRQVEVFLTKYKPLIRSYIRKYSLFNDNDIEDVYQDIACYLWYKVPLKYKFDKPNGMFFYCKKMTYWYLRRLSRLRGLKQARKLRCLEKRPPISERTSHESKESIELLDLEEHLGKFITTDRERQVLDLLIQNYTQLEIAKTLGVCRETVRRVLVKFKKYLDEVK